MAEAYKKKDSVLLREDFDGGPISIDNIDSKLWLGNVTSATDALTLNRLNITHILTIDLCPLPRRITDLPKLKVKYIQLADLPREDIMTHFEEAYEFIENGSELGNVLVHCYYGISRSATIVIAYMMKKHGLSYRKAFNRVKEKRSLVCPNEGFISQLKLYEEMGYKIDKNDKKYKQFRLGVAADKVRKVRILPQEFIDLIKPDPGLTQVNPEPKVYRCKSCRRIVASESNILTHKERRKLLKSEEKEKEEERITCTRTYFVEPLTWMNNIGQSLQGKLHCPKCSAKLGSFSWIMGCQCPCGTKVAPAFYLIPSKVEWSNVVQNVQVTV